MLSSTTYLLSFAFTCKALFSSWGNFFIGEASAAGPDRKAGHATVIQTMKINGRQLAFIGYGDKRRILGYYIIVPSSPIAKKTVRVYSKAKLLDPGHTKIS